MSNTANKFLAAHRLSFRAVRVSERTDGLMSEGRDPGQRHFRVEFRTLATDFALVTFFSQGSAHKKDPTAAEVLECLASDARGVVDATDVLDFASEFGWELDTPEQLNHLRLVFAGCNETLDALDKLVGEDARNDLLCLDFDGEE
jgi:hypothetical protein